MVDDSNSSSPTLRCTCGFSLPCPVHGNDYDPEAVSSPTRRAVVRQLIAKWRAPLGKPWDDRYSASWQQGERAALNACAEELEAALGEPTGAEVLWDALRRSVPTSEGGEPVTRVADEMTRILSQAEAALRSVNVNGIRAALRCIEILKAGDPVPRVVRGDTKDAEEL